MAVAAVLAHAANGFFMNFSDKQAGEGVEYFILLVGIGLALTIAGPGRIAILKRF
jgi:putative oxidoreductase